jgi:RNA polymerase sigma-70 factor (ECF subfamily)
MLGSEAKGINVEELYLRYGPMILRRCRTLLKDEDKALDAMQEVFVRLMTHRKRLKAQFPSSLLYRMATNVCLNKIRSENTRSAWGDETILANIACYEEKEKGWIIRLLLARIFKREKESTRDMAVMHYVDGMTLKEIAHEVGLSFSGVRKRLRGLRIRIEQMKEECNGQE